MSCGFYSILASFKGDFENAAWGILLAHIFDGLDGWIARLTNSSSKFGIQLDSLSDLVGFAVAPAVLLYSWGLNNMGRLGWGASFFFVMCGALRLARYNVQMDSTESKAFTGMPAPGAATVVAAFVLFYIEIWGDRFQYDYLAVILTILLGLLMVSTIKYHGAKEIDLKRRKPFLFLFWFVCIFSLIYINPPVVIFLFSFTYMIWGITEAVYIHFKKIREKKTAGPPDMCS